MQEPSCTSLWRYNLVGQSQSLSCGRKGSKVSRYHPDDWYTLVLEAAERWKKVCLEAEGSMFGSDSLWVTENFDELERTVGRHPDIGEGNYIQKLQGQLEPASADAKRLGSEMHWAMLLCPSNITPPKKRQVVAAIWEFGDSTLKQDTYWFREDVLHGIGSAGMAFNTHRWREFNFFIELMRALKRLSSDERNELFGDGWRMAKWLEEVKEHRNRQFRHMFLYLLFPDNFEPIFGGIDRRAIIAGFTGLSTKEVRKLSPTERDRKLLQIRTEQEEKHGTHKLTFYHSPLKEVWNEKEFDKATKGIEAEHVIEALKQIDDEGIPDDARSTMYDLVHASKRYPPKYVLSLASQVATGEELDRQTFTGGESSKAFRLLRKLGFQIERKDLLKEMIQRFLTQADTAEDLTVSEYPKAYRELRLKVGFGQGTVAKIPWISFLADGQTTQNGIYPVLLYYKDHDLLMLAYGISETNAPQAKWANSDELQTVAEYFSKELNNKPFRYGSSFFFAAHRGIETIDLDRVVEDMDRLISLYHEQMERNGNGEPAADYTVDDALVELFMSKAEFESILARLKQKKNLIVQGPPGVGKTFVCKRVAYALMGRKDASRLGMVQFHQSYAYEDFIQGYRPTGDGFRLKNGVFYKFCTDARNDPASTYVFIVDEINRGNLSKVFGELMMLIESDKRGEEWAIPLAYALSTDEKFYIPENLYLIGLMNTADRSLAMVDYALRRRFAFVDLKPAFEQEEFAEHLAGHNTDESLIKTIVKKLTRLNQQIAEDMNLGAGYCVGHSFFCVTSEDVEPNVAWYRDIISTEIEPLLREYYFDDTKKAQALVEELLQGV